MPKRKPYKTCRCGKTFSSKLEMYQQSIPVGLQETDKKNLYDLELRLCPRCKTTFAVKIRKKKKIYAKTFAKGSKFK